MGLAASPSLYQVANVRLGFDRSIFYHNRNFPAVQTMNPDFGCCSYLCDRSVPNRYGRYLRTTYSGGAKVFDPLYNA